MSTIFDISLFKTIRFNLHYFGTKGLRLPVLVSKNLILKSLRGGVEVESYATGNIRIGFDGTGICDTRYQRGIWDVHGKVHLGQNVKISAGTKIGCSSDGMLYIGKNSSINVNSQVICMQSINIGEDTIISWDDLIMDSDFHQVNDGTRWKEVSKHIDIGDNVWIGSRVCVLKGSTVPDGCVVAANSTITYGFSEQHCLLSTNSIIRRGISWKR